MPQEAPSVKVRYRISVSKPITVPYPLNQYFNGRYEVAPGSYELTVDHHQIDKEREIQRLQSSYPGVTCKIVRTIME